MVEVAVGMLAQNQVEAGEAVGIEQLIFFHTEATSHEFLQQIDLLRDELFLRLPRHYLKKNNQLLPEINITFDANMHYKLNDV